MLSKTTLLAQRYKGHGAMRYVLAQISLSFFAEGTHEKLSEKVQEAMNIACHYLEQELKHEAISYNLTQFKTDEE
jgi:uncharacterized protein YqeY